MAAVPRRKVAASLRTLDPQLCSHATPQSTTLGLHPVIHIPNYMDHYSFTDPEGWMGELAMLADRQRTFDLQSDHPSS